MKFDLYSYNMMHGITSTFKHIYDEKSIIYKISYSYCADNGIGINSIRCGALQFYFDDRYHGRVKLLTTNESYYTDHLGLLDEYVTDLNDDCGIFVPKWIYIVDDYNFSRFKDVSEITEWAHKKIPRQNIIFWLA